MSSAAPSLVRIQIERAQIAAARDELTLRIRRREVVEIERLKHGIIGLAHRVRDLLLMSPHRQGATLATRHGLDAGPTVFALIAIMRAALTAIANEGREQSQER
jgi:hypothetical protein